MRLRWMPRSVVLAIAFSTAFVTSAHAQESVSPSDKNSDDTEVIAPRQVDRQSLSRILQGSHEVPLSGEAWRKLGIDVESALIEVVRDRSQIFGARIRAMHALAALRSEPGRQMLSELAASKTTPEELRNAAVEALDRWL